MKNRKDALRSIAGNSFDVCIIGGGATGSGCALDAQLRGLKTVLFEASDFAGGTSSASTKIVHGGVRYLEEAVRDFDPAQYRVVTRALHERVRMLKNAPHLAHTMEFLLPCYRWTDVAYYDLGLKVYDWVSRNASIFPSHFISKENTLRRMPGLKRENLLGAVVFADGQFDDARYNITLIDTFAAAGGEPLNYARVTRFEKDSGGRLRAAEIEDQVTRQKFMIHARAFVNATGPFSDTLRILATPGVAPRMRLSKGIHILLTLDVLPSRDALLIPKTEDGRVLFAVPWMGRLLVGTTEQEVSIHDELYVTKEEVAYVLHHLNRYLERPVGTEQVISGIAGARPLVSSTDARDTKRLARDDVLEIDSNSGLISIMGGKWTTYRAMGEDTINAVQDQLRISRTVSPTRDHSLLGAEGYSSDYWKKLVEKYGITEQVANHLAGKFGTRAQVILELARQSHDLRQSVAPGLPVIRAEVVFCVRNEMALTIEDILFRRTGVQLFSWQAAIRAAPAIASILREELDWSADEEQAAVLQYQEKLTRFLDLAGLKKVSVADIAQVNPNDRHDDDSKE
jgi:glycerol-3-phosphate dehydrogenase